MRYFAFPYGLHRKSVDARRFAWRSRPGYDGVCSAYGGYNFPGDDAFHLRRFHADPEFVRFKNWLTVDPRKVRKQRDFDPGDYKLERHSDLRRIDRHCHSLTESSLPLALNLQSFASHSQ